MKKIIAAIILLSIIVTALFIDSYAKISSRDRQTAKDLMYQLDSANKQIELLKTDKSINLNDSILFSYINRLNIKYPHIVFAQAKIESNVGKSFLAKKTNNLFGMRCAKARPHTYIGETNSGFAIYKNWMDSVLDYALMQSHYYRCSSEDDYYKLLQQSFSESENYVSLIKEIADNVKSNL